MDDLQAIQNYAEAYSAAYADRLTTQLVKATRMLENFPEAGRMVPEVAHPAVREVLKNGYRIVYRIVSPLRIDILRIHSGARPVTATALQ